jgi:hypothetical protein
MSQVQTLPMQCLKPICNGRVLNKSYPRNKQCNEKQIFEASQLSGVAGLFCVL